MFPPHSRHTYTLCMCRPMYNYLYLSSILCCNSRNKHIFIFIYIYTSLELALSKLIGHSCISIFEVILHSFSSAERLGYHAGLSNFSQNETQSLAFREFPKHCAMKIRLSALYAEIHKYISSRASPNFIRI